MLESHPKVVIFTDLIRDDDPGSMDVAEDFLLQNGITLREVTGGLRAVHFTIDLVELSGSFAEWKMVQVSVFETPKIKKHFTVEYAVANGPVRVNRAEQYRGIGDGARRYAVATSWAIAKAIKPLPMATSKTELEGIVDDTILNGLHNITHEDLF